MILLVLVYFLIHSTQEIHLSRQPRELPPLRAGFRAYLSALRPSPASSPSTGAQNDAMQHRCYYLRQKLLHDVCHQSRMTGKRTVVFFGARPRGDRHRQDGCERWCPPRAVLPGISGGSLGGFFSFFFPFSFTIGGRLRPEPSVGD